MTKLLKKSSLLAFFLLFLQTELAFGVSQIGNARVTILETVQLAEKKVVDFGEIMADNGSCTLTAAGNVEAGNGANCGGNGQVGEFQISGKANQSISISVEAGEASKGVNFLPELHSEAQTVLKDGVAVAKIGGQLDLNNAEAGDHNLTYVLVVNYD